MEFNFDKYHSMVVDTLNTSYDYASVMHYETDAFSANGLPTIEPLTPGIPIGQRVNLSATDILEVRLLYNCSANGVTLPPIPTTTIGKSMIFETSLIIDAGHLSVNVSNRQVWVSSFKR